MAVTTLLQPVTRTRADELYEMLHAVQQGEDKAIALDDKGFATGVVDVDDPQQEHLLGDLDVHA